mmetsp:Transcript_23694/g.26384  ORF Transcript_23694/g.26384 Transcript_23694/m.26384 type:complete len:692 (-) Transcript_23694:208-2283(-)
MKMLLSDGSRKMNNKKHEQRQGYGSSEENILSIMDDMIDEDDDDEEKENNHTPDCLAPFQQQQERDVTVTFYAPFVPLMKLSLSMIAFVTIGVVIMTTVSFHNHSPPPVSTTRQQQETLVSLAGINTRNGMESTHSTAGLRGDDDDGDDDDSNDYSFQEFCVKYNKNYNDDEDEYDRRQKIFTANVHKIMHHNQKKNSSFQLGINQFTDLTANELPLGLDKSASMKSSIPGIRAFAYELFPATTMENENESETDKTVPTNRNLQMKKKKKKHSQKDGDDEDEEDDTDNDDSTNTDTDEDAAIKLIASLPKSVDWRTVILPDSKSRVTTPIKNQGQCGSCWAFASMTALESHIAIATGFLFTFSTQELISCAPNQDHCGSVAGGYGGGCNGSTGELAYDFISSGRGIVTEWDWGYISYAGSRGTCPLQPSPFSTDGDDDNDADTSTTSTTKSVKKNRKLYSSSDSSSDSDSSSSDSSSSDSDSSSSDSLLDLFSNVFSSVQDDEEERETTVDLLIPGAVASITGHTQLRTNSYVELLHAVATQGPVVVNVAASDGWLSYQGGIFTDLHEETRDINHVVVVEGYGTDPDTHQDFWLVRNSWGPLWGEQGYIRLHRVNPYNQQACTANANAAKAATAGNKKLLDPCGECKMDLTPQDGIACVGPDFSITPKPVMVCGTSGILYDAVLPVGGSLL